MTLRIKRIYEPPEPADGHRLLVMRFWPRGVRKENVDSWDRGLAPTRELLADFNSGAIEWSEFSKRFLLEMSERQESIDAIQALRERSAREVVTLLCWCRDENRCHRSLLRDLLATDR